MNALLRKLWNDESGQGLVEYALLVGFVAVIVVASYLLFRDSIETVLENLNNYLTDNGDPGNL